MLYCHELESHKSQGDASPGQASAHLGCIIEMKRIILDGLALHLQPGWNKKTAISLLSPQHSTATVRKQELLVTLRTAL